jgi:Outer membrane protein beta-barrel domain
MKKIITTVFFIISIVMTNAQTKKGDWMVGGGLRLNTSENNTEIAFEPNAGIFIINNFAFGGNIALDYTKAGDTKITSFGIGPFLRYYFTNAHVRPLIHGHVNYLSTKVKTPGTTSTNNGVNFFLGGGAAIFIGDQVSLDILLGYDHTKYKDFDGSGGFALTIGFQVYLLQHQVQRLGGK